MDTKVMMITGAAKNTGYAIAGKFAREGYSVAITSRRQSDADMAASQLSQTTGAKVLGYELSMTDIEETVHVFEKVEKDLGKISVFIANAANLGLDIPFLEATPKQFDSVMNTNLRGTFFCCQQAALQMKQLQKGSLVIIGSVHYRQSVFGRSLYAASKGGLASLVRSMAYELAPYGIRANCIVAGAIRTERWDGLSQEQIAAKRANWPLGIESTGTDIANAAFYLGTDLSATVTGTDLTVDSGISICLLPYAAQKK